MVRGEHTLTIGRVEPPLPEERPDPERGIEDWIASNLDGGNAPASAMDALHEQISLSFRLGSTPKQQKNGKKSAAASAWEHLRVSRQKGITLVKIVDRELIKDAEIREFAEELECLIVAGYDRIVLDFSNVERLSSQIVGAVVAAHRRCLLADGGLLKVCRLQPAVADIFAITGMARTLTITTDQPEAIDGPWPASSGPRPLPVAVLSVLIGTDGTKEGHPLENVSEPSAEAGKISFPVRLIVASGRACGRIVIVPATGLLIGRAPTCKLRARSETVSREHARIEFRDDRVIVRDLGSTNGTLLDGQTLRAQEAELTDGAQLQVGPMIFHVEIGKRSAAPIDQIIADWCLDDEPEPFAPSIDDTSTDLSTFPTLEDEDGTTLLRYEVIEDVLVITPLIWQLDDPERIEGIRKALLTLFDQPLPRRVVVNLDCVSSLTGRAVGILLAHHMRLARCGGSLRLCQAQARVGAVLEQIRLPMLVSAYASVDDAVLTAWA